MPTARLSRHDREILLAHGVDPDEPRRCEGGCDPKTFSWCTGPLCRRCWQPLAATHTVELLQADGRVERIPYASLFDALDRADAHKGAARVLDADGSVVVTQSYGDGTSAWPRIGTEGWS